VTTTAEVLTALQAQGAPRPLLDFVGWAGPRLEAVDDPELFYLTYQLALAELSDRRAGLRGSLVGRPPRLYLPLTLAVRAVASAYQDPEFALRVDRVRLGTH